VSSYSYDADGNLSGSASGGSFTYNSQNQTTAITWNAQTLSGLTYADVGQAERTAAGSTTFASSPFGVQVSATGGGNTYFLRDGKGNVLGQRLPDSSHWYYLKDGLGSVVAVINGAGTTVANRYGYDPYGKLTASTGTQANPWGYAGGYRDSTGLIKFGTRYYDPNLGRWTQQDSLPGAVTSPSSLNRYIYTQCDPVNATDPSGRNCMTSTVALGIVVVGVLVGALAAPETGGLSFALVVYLATGAIGGAGLGWSLAQANADCGWGIPTWSPF
jgi:RHS repeat-associated protein